MAKKMNAYMTALNKARKSGASSFSYKGKTYKKSKTKTGMVIYKAKQLWKNIHQFLKKKTIILVLQQELQVFQFIKNI